MSMLLPKTLKSVLTGVAYGLLTVGGIAVVVVATQTIGITPLLGLICQKVVETQFFELTVKTAPVMLATAAVCYKAIK